MTAEPRHHTPRSDLPTRGGQVAAIAEAKGRPFLPWQRRAADVALEFDPATGLYRYGTVVVTVQRQAGKTTWVGTLADHRCLSRPGARVWLTMQNGKMADSWMRNEHLPSLLPLGNPDRPGAHYRRSLRAGEIGPLWPALNSTFFTFPPKRDALHSKQSDLVVISEAWALSMEQGTDVRQAARPTMATRPGAQLLVESTLGDDSSVWLDSYIDLGIASLERPDDTRVCFIDYGIPDDADPEDLDVIKKWHPAYGLTMNDQAFVDAREEFDTDVSGWARAYGNRASRSREAAIPPTVWNQAQRPRLDVPDRAGLALDATPSGDRFALSAAWRDDSPPDPADAGDAWVELVAGGATTRETPDLIASLLRARRVPLVVDRAAIGAVEIVDQVAKVAPDVTISYVGMHEYASACGVIKRGLMADEVHHFGQSALTAAVEVVSQRDLGDGAFGWGRRGSSGSICEFVSATLALRAFDTLPAPSRKPRIRTGVR